MALLSRMSWEYFVLDKPKFAPPMSSAASSEGLDYFSIARYFFAEERHAVGATFYDRVEYLSGLAAIDPYVVHEGRALLRTALRHFKQPVAKM